MEAIATAPVEASNAPPLPQMVWRLLDRPNLDVVVPLDLPNQALHRAAMSYADTGLRAASLLKASPEGEGFHPPRLGH